MVSLVENEYFVEFGKKFKDERDWRKKHDTVNTLYRTFNPEKKADSFFELSPSEVNKLALVVAAKAVASNLKTSQIRKILNMSTAIHRKVKNGRDISADVAKLRYILAYAAARQRKSVLPLAEVLDRIIPKLNEKNYEKFHDFLQAIVAYHKLLGGGDY